MSYINAMKGRHIFAALRSRLIRKKYSLKKIFWMTGLLAFIISPIADNLTTSLIMAAVITQIAKGNHKFILLSCVNIVVAANAGGAFSPFGDITTLMVWQRGIIDFFTFFVLIPASLCTWLIPAYIMSRKISGNPTYDDERYITTKRGAKSIMFLFGVTVALAVSAHALFDMPPVLGMLPGLALLGVFSYVLQKTNGENVDVFNAVSHSDWDTLLFFGGVILTVAGLNVLGYLALVSNLLYTQWHHSWANISVGIISAIVDNIPVMFAVLEMRPDMSITQWLLVTLSCGTGGSLLSIGSAAGVALMGSARSYTFLGHLKWTPVIFLGYILSDVLFISSSIPS